VREVHIVGIVSGVPADDVFVAVTDIERFPTLCEDVREVRIDDADGARRSSWTVKFRGGVLEWTELDTSDPDARTMSFRQIDGDFKEFDGAWRVEAVGTDSVVRFAARFDLGIPGLRAVVEPIAAKSLRNNLSTVLRGLFGSDLRVEEA